MRWIAGERALKKQPAGFRGSLRRRSRRSTIFILYYFGRFAEKFLLVIVLFIGDSFLH